MKVYLLRERVQAEFNDSYAMRLIEQGKAVFVTPMKGEAAKPAPVKAKNGAEKGVEESAAEALGKTEKRAKGSEK